MAIYGYRLDGSPIKTQWELILFHLQTNPGTTITSWEAIKEFGFTRLSAIVKEIEYHTKIVLKRRDIKIKTRYGGSVWVTEYWYGDESGQDK